MGTDEPRRRRHRRPVDPAPIPVPASPAAVPGEESARPAARKRGGRETGERGLRDLVGAGHSQLGVSGALRGRDVDRATKDDLAAAERDVEIVRRHWKPRD